MDKERLIETLCIEEERIVARDNTVSYGRRKLQLPESRVRPHYVCNTEHRSKFRAC